MFYLDSRMVNHHRSNHQHLEEIQVKIRSDYPYLQPHCDPFCIFFSSDLWGLPYFPGTSGQQNRSPSYALNASREAGTWGCLFGRGEPEDDGDATKKGMRGTGRRGWSFVEFSWWPSLGLTRLQWQKAAIHHLFPWDQDLFQLSLIKYPSDTNQEIITF